MAHKRSRDSDLNRQHQGKRDPAMADARRYQQQQEHKIHKDVESAIQRKTFYVETPAMYAATWDKVQSTSQDVRDGLFVQGSGALRFEVNKLYARVFGKQADLWNPTLFQLSKKVRHGHLHTVTGGDVQSATRGFFTWVGGMLEEEKGAEMVTALVDAVFLPLLEVAKESHESFARASKRPRLQRDDAEEVLFLHRFYTVMVAKKRVKPNPPPPSPSVSLAPHCSDNADDEAAAHRSSAPAPVAYSSPPWRPQSTPRSALNDTPMNFKASPPWGEDEDMSSRDPCSFTEEHDEFGRDYVPFSTPTFTPFDPFTAAATHAPGFPELTAPPPAALPCTLASTIRLSTAARGNETSLQWLEKSASAENYEGEEEDGDWDMDMELQYPPGVESSCNSPSIELCQDAIVPVRGPAGLAMTLNSLRNSG